ncbi:MAG TPA: glycine betaine ABC transporter substrate-binding protein [Nocardia sp.]|uniref:glycine betaine ABC transporter substrate-binding protein n=1 Tax=Nocardia TaxID=1817 RepID=UPI002454AA53|nr:MULTISPECIES: glycine betaine ABC transporter substrate-binding protein [Nocardia]HLS76252.1 glycine betaine ABC transporter substrate-binding protein [Nocardia sp.]
MLALAALVALVTAACGGEPERTFVVGAGDSTESLVLAEIYAGALARTGQPVRVHPGLGPRRDYLAALDEGTIDLVGEQTGELLAALDSTAEARTPDEVVTALYRALPADLTLADPADGADMRPRVLVTEQRAQAENLTTVEDLLPRCPETTAAQASAPGLLRAPAEVAVHDCPFATVTPVPDPAALAESLRSGAARAGLLTGPPELVPDTTGLRVLADQDYALRAENIVPLLRTGLLDEVRLRKLNYVAGELTTAELAEMIRAVEAGESAAETARRWLDAHGL